MKDDGEQNNEAALGEIVDLEAWDAQLPPSDFAERVLSRVREGERLEAAKAVQALPRRSRARRWGIVVGGATALAIAAAVLLRVSTPPSAGEAIATDRVEVALGSRALAVLEPGASVRWNGDDVVQSRGDVFYRVEPGARFTVHTPAGEAEVKGTCFAVKVRPVGVDEKGTAEEDMQKRDVKAGAVGAAISALAFVVVYEGKVAVSHASDHVDLRAGEAAQTGPDGVKRTGANAEKDFDRDVAAAQAGDDPLSKANRNLVQQVGEYRTRLEAIAREKGELEAKLKKSEDHLAASQDGAPYVAKHAFDLSQDDWKELAKDGVIKYQLPCINVKEPWSPSAEKLNALGLAPQDGKVLTDAYKRSSERLWNVIKPLCAASVGSPEVAARLGPGTCIHVVLDAEYDRDPEATRRAKREVGEIRAGTRTMPGADEGVHPVMKMFLATTGATKSLEDDIAQSLGPQDAHRIVYSNELCMGTSEFGASPKK